MPSRTQEARVSRHDSEIAAIRKLILTGMKLIMVENQKGLKELRAMQKKTEATLDRFIAKRQVH